MINLTSILSTCLEDVISKYRLNLISVSDSEALLKSSTYAIHVVVDNDGVNMIYFDIRNKSLEGYNIFLYLFNNRYDRLIFPGRNKEITDCGDFITEQVKSLASHIRNAGEDILSGSKNWITDYRSPVVRASSDVARLILKSSG